MPGERWTSRRPGLHLDQNVLGLLRRDSLGLDSGPLGWPLFRCRTARSAPVLLFGRKRGTRKSRLETKTENEACSALLARLWCHLPLQNPANRAENLIRLCSATICQTGWRMVQSGAIRSRPGTLNNREKQGKTGNLDHFCADSAVLPRRYHYYYRNTARLESDAPRRVPASSEFGSARPRRLGVRRA